MSFAVADSSSASPTTSTFLHSGTLVLSKSLRETHAPQQVLETRVGTQSVIPKVGVNRPQCVLVPLNPLFQPVAGELLFRQLHEHVTLLHSVAGFVANRAGGH